MQFPAAFLASSVTVFFCIDRCAGAPLSLSKSPPPFNPLSSTPHSSLAQRAATDLCRLW
ncbi:hypothetical protein PF011_g12450 [Phytophthora fragariae]|uniref:RxLR effector protein n=1 Tax=Phytophthora fragariae TaxID=53985 RepID=A0A6A3KHY2_9STRA|nr:hypothetical protein PF011_g12450 [Phytophthora fragariae]